MSSESNIAKVRRLLQQGFGEGDLSIVDEYVSPEFIEHQNGAQGIGPEALKNIIRGLHASFTEMSLFVEDIVASGDDVWVRSLARGVNTRPIMGRPPTGKDFQIEVVDVIRFLDGKMIAHWGVADRLGMLEQLGMQGEARRETA